MSVSFPTDDPSWNLEPIFSGGVESAEFFEEVEALEGAVRDIHHEVEAIELPETGPVNEEVRQQWCELLKRYFSVWQRCSEASSYARALASAHTDQPEALRMPSQLDEVNTGRRAIRVALQAAVSTLSEEGFASIVGDERFSKMQLWLRELRRDAQRAMPPGMEALTVELNRDGFHAWGRLYSEVSGRLDVEIERDGEVEIYSVAQAKNLLESPRREVRQAAFDGLQEAWTEAAPVCASALNSIRGVEQTLYRRRGGDCLTRALDANRVQRSTVEAMFGAAEEFRPVLERYLKAKARVLGLEKLDWYDLNAPVGEGDDEGDISYREAQEFIVEQVADFSPEIAEFCRHALAHQWVEAEDRPGKRQGGYCTFLPVSKEIRIFMTFGGTNSGVTTLAHELGHGYHGDVMKDLPASQRVVPMGLAETASTFLEALVEQAALRQASPDQRLALLDDRLGRAVTFLMDIPARYRLEKAMHKHRAEGALHQDVLTDATREIFEDVYGGGVASVDELFWASKLHFFLTHLPFYNFPYTFGYLFSRAVYARAIEEGEGFVERIDALLRDTGRMTAEEVAKKHLDADLGDRAFWKKAAGTLAEDVERYEALADRQ